MGIEARRNLNNKISKSDDENDEEFEVKQNLDENRTQIADEILRLNKLKKDGLLTEEEFEKAKEKLLN